MGFNSKAFYEIRHKLVLGLIELSENGFEVLLLVGKVEQVENVSCTLINFIFIVFRLSGHKARPRFRQGEDLFCHEDGSTGYQRVGPLIHFHFYQAQLAHVLAQSELVRVAFRQLAIAFQKLQGGGPLHVEFNRG